jgi:hypothetical protein
VDFSPLIPILIPILIIAVLGIFLLLIISSQWKLEIEKDKKLLYSSTAGGWIGGISYRGPFISLRMYDEFIIIVCVRTYVLKYDEIVSVEIKRWMGLIPDRIQIKHRNPSIPKDIVIGTYSPSRAREIIDARLRTETTS